MGTFLKIIFAYLFYTNERVLLLPPLISKKIHAVFQSELLVEFDNI